MMQGLGRLLGFGPLALYADDMVVAYSETSRMRSSYVSRLDLAVHHK